MRVPPWLSLIVAGLVTIFGLYRLRMAFRNDEADAAAKRRGGLYARGRRTHFLFGVVYLLLGAWLIAGVLGYEIVPWKLFDNNASTSTTTTTAPEPATPVTPVAPPAN